MLGRYVLYVREKVVQGLRTWEALIHRSYHGLNGFRQGLGCDGGAPGRSTSQVYRTALLSIVKS